MIAPGPVNDYPEVVQGSLWLGDGPSVWHVAEMTPAGDGNPSVVLVRIGPQAAPKRLSVTARWLVGNPLYLHVDAQAAQAVLDATPADKSIRRRLLGEAVFFFVALPLAALAASVAEWIIPPGVLRALIQVCGAAASFNVIGRAVAAAGLGPVPTRAPPRGDAVGRRLVVKVCFILGAMAVATLGCWWAERCILSGALRALVQVGGVITTFSIAAALEQRKP